jgi:hypothetical protein
LRIEKENGAISTLKKRKKINSANIFDITSETDKSGKKESLVQKNIDGFKTYIVGEEIISISNDYTTDSKNIKSSIIKVNPESDKDINILKRKNMIDVDIDRNLNKIEQYDETISVGNGKKSKIVNFINYLLLYFSHIFNFFKSFHPAKFIVSLLLEIRDYLPFSDLKKSSSELFSLNTTEENSNIETIRKVGDKTFLDKKDENNSLISNSNEKFALVNEFGDTNIKKNKTVKRVADDELVDGNLTAFFF